MYMFDVHFHPTLSPSLPRSLSFNQITGTNYAIDNLTPNSNYEGQVCRANGSVSDPDNCGSCLFCFSTTIAQGNSTHDHILTCH